MRHWWLKLKSNTNLKFYSQSEAKLLLNEGDKVLFSDFISHQLPTGWIHNVLNPEEGMFIKLIFSKNLSELDLILS